MNRSLKMYLLASIGQILQWVISYNVKSIIRANLTNDKTSMIIARCSITTTTRTAFSVPKLVIVVVKQWAYGPPSLVENCLRPRPCICRILGFNYVMGLEWKKEEEEIKKKSPHMQMQ